MFNAIKERLLRLPLSKKIVIFVCTMAVITPMILVSAFVSVYYYLGVEYIFGTQIKKSLNKAIEISKLYNAEKLNNIKNDALNLANALNNVFLGLNGDIELLNSFLDEETNKLMLTEAMIIKNDSIIAHSSLSFSLSLAGVIKIDESLNSGEIRVRENKKTNKIYAIMRLDHLYPNIIMGNNVYLVVGRYLDEEINQHLIDTTEAAIAYENLESTIKKTRMRIVYLFFAITILLFIIAIILSKRFSKLISEPIKQLSDATKRVKEGQYNFQVPEIKSDDEIALFAGAFNIMVKTIEQNNIKLLHAKSEINERKNFIELILSEQSAGIITIDKNGKIILTNNSANKLLKLKGDQHNRYYCEVFPELELIIGDIYDPNKPSISEHANQKNIEYIITKDDDKRIHHIEVKLISNSKRHYFIRCGIVHNKENDIEMIIVAFDDITDVVLAQRFAAWGEIARRIAHEIKNPLTPIQLASERLEKKFIDQINNEDKENFRRYLETISKRVDDIKRMVQDFVDFAKISTPHFEKCEINKLIEEVILLEKNRAKNIDFIFKIFKTPCFIKCDQMQIRQVFTNILKNAIESIEAKLTKNIKVTKGKKGFSGKIEINVIRDNKNDKKIKVIIHDNGIGIDKDLIDRICEPYISTKESGNGLGLSIVKKILEEHGSSFVIQNRNNDNNDNSSGVVIEFTLDVYDT